MNEPARTGDPDLIGYSLANVSDVIVSCLDAAGAGTVMEIGSFRGTLTEALVEWAAKRGATVTAVEPQAPPELVELTSRNSHLSLRESTSHEVLREAEPPAAIVLDGDHNYSTLSRELQIVGERAPGSGLPLLLFHDVCWPHARRDTYYAPERIPESERQPLAWDVRLRPENPGVAPTGLHFDCAAAREGGERNGVLTAIEDFMAERDGLRLAIVPAFFGLGVLWHEEAPWAAAVAEVVAPLDRNPLLERLESNRVAQLVTATARGQQLGEEHARLESMRRLLRRMLGSRALGVAEAVSRLGQRGGPPVVSRAEIRDALRDGDG
jgi:hypothetical protein